MASSSPAPHKLMSAMRELAAQSERVARAEARVVASRVGDVAQASARRMVLSLASALLGTLALGFLLVAAYDALSARVPGWEAALIVAGSTLIVALLCMWGASASPSVSASLMPHSDDRGEQP